MRPVKIDGTTLEGGGQLVRIVIGLSALTGRGVELVNIRGGRPGGGGLKAQHLTAVRWLADAVQARVEGLELKSKRLLFEPGQGSGRAKQWWKPAALADGTRARAVHIDLGSPGSITLVLQALLPFLLFASEDNDDDKDGAPILLTLSGGTNVSFSPSVEYVAHVLIPNLARLGLANVSVVEQSKPVRGWTTGRNSIGSATYLIHPVPQHTTLAPLLFPPTPRPRPTKHTVTHFSACILAPGALPRRALQNALTQHLSTHFPQPSEPQQPKLQVLVDEDSRHDKRLYLLLIAHLPSGTRLGRDWLYDGKQSKDAQGVYTAVERLARTVVEGMVEEVDKGEPVDGFMADQVAVFAALAEGRSAGVGVAGGETLHARTSRWAAERLLGVEFEADGGCEGAAFVMGRPWRPRRRRRREEEGMEDDLARLDLSETLSEEEEE